MKRILSLLLALAMTVTMLPQVTVFAQEEQTQQTETPPASEEVIPQETVTAETVTDETGGDLPTDPNDVYEYAKNMDFTTDDPEGKVTLTCPVCCEAVEWLPLAVNQTGNSMMMAGGHYYLSEEADYTANTGLYNFYKVQACINLNGQVLFSENRAFYNEGTDAELNIMGEGTVSGNGLINGTVSRAVLDATGNVNLFGGTYSSANSATPAVEQRKSSAGEAYVRVYEGTKILHRDGGYALGIINRGNLNICGGILGSVYHQGTGTITVSGEPAIELLDLTGGKTIVVDGLTEGASIAVAADGVFTQAMDNPHDYLHCFKAASADAYIMVENNMLSVGKQEPEPEKSVYQQAVEMDFSAGGTVTAMCPVCCEDVEWTPLAAIQSTTVLKLTGGHYYLSEDLNNSGFYNVNAVNVCINLNGHDLDSVNRAFYVNTNAVLNMMGDGVVSGIGLVQSSYNRAVLDITAKVNLYGGTYISNNADAAAAEVRAKTGNLCVYEGTTILNSAGGNALGIFRYGNLNLYGGKMGTVYDNQSTGTITVSGTPEIEKLTLSDGVTLTASGSCGGNLSWTLDGERVLTVSGEGEMDSYFEGGAPWYVYADYIRTVVLEQGISYVGDNAFYGCGSLTGATYKGTAEQWNGVRVGGGNESLLNLAISFESLVTGVTIDPVTLTAETNGAWYTDSETGNRYYQYYWWMNMHFVINMRDGGVIEGEGTSFDYNGESVSIDTFDDQSVHNLWLPGNTYYPTVNVMGYTVTVPVTIEESFVSSIVVDPIEIYENTCGETWLEDGGTQSYYRYLWWNRITFTVYLKNGEEIRFGGSGFWYNDIWYNVTHSDNQSYQTPWTVGNCYSGSLSIAGCETWVSVSIVQNPVVSVEFAPLSILSDTCGVFSYDESLEAGGYYYYQWWTQLSYTVTFADGCVETYLGSGITHHGEQVEMGCGDNQGSYTPWTAGNTYDGWVTIAGRSYTVSVTIQEAEITGITARPLSIPAGTGGSLTRGDSSNEYYFRYEWWKQISYTVSFCDGTSMEVTGDTFSYNGIDYELVHSDSQHEWDRWTEGGTYSVTLSVPGGSVTTEVSVSAPQPELIDLPELVLGGDTTVSIVENGGLAVFKFVPQESGMYVITSNTDRDTYAYLYNSNYECLMADDDAGNGLNFKLDADLVAGEVYIVAMRFLGSEITGDFPVSAVKAIGIARVEFRPVSIPVNTCGSMEYSDSEAGSYYHYYWWNRLYYTVYFENGDSINTGGTGFGYNDVFYSLRWADSQSASTPWTEGNTYGVEVTLAGKTYPVNVTIESSPIASVTLNPIVMAQEGYGHYTYGWNESTGSEEEYFRYYWWNCINYEITFKDGTTASGTGSGYGYDGQYIDFEYSDDQDTVHWKLGGVYYPTVNVAGELYTVQVSIQPVRLQSIEISPVILMENTGGYWENSYSGEYYRYCWWDQLKYTLVFENGTVYQGGGSSFYFNGQWCSLHFSDDQTFDNAMVLGGSYAKEVRVFGQTVPVQVSITDSVGGSAGDSVAWTLDSEGNFVLSGFGSLYEYNSSDGMEWARYKSDIRTVTVADGITDLGRFAFYNCDNLTSVTFGNTLQNTGEWTFYSCDQLSEVVFSDSVETVGYRAFYECIGLESITLGNCVTTVLTQAFAYCTNLREVTLPASLREVNDWSFYPCSDLQTVYFQGTQMAWSCVIHYGHTGLFDVNVECLGVAEILAEGTCGDLSWKVDSDGLLSFEGQGAIPDYTAEALPEWKAYADSIRVVKLGEGIAEIGNYAFYEFPALQRVDAETMVTRVGDYAFYNCDTLGAFSLREMDVIGSYAFADCEGIFYISLGNSWTSIGDYAFSGAGVSEVDYNGPGYKFYQENIGIGNEELLNAWIYSIEEEGVVLSGRCGDSVYFIHYETGEVKIFGEGAMFDYDFQEQPWKRFSYPVFAINIEEGVTYIGNYAFAHCGNAKTLTIPGTVTRIGEGAFWDLANVKTVTIPEGVEEIAANAFNFSGMEELSLPDSLKRIGNEAFRQCDCLTEIYIPKGVEIIEQNAFMACHALTSIRVDEENAFFSSDDRGVLYNKDQTVLVCAPSFISGSFTVPETVQRIESWAFAHCTDLSEVVMGDNVTEIGVFAFNGCYALTSVTFGSGITALPGGIFMEAGLSEFVIPEGITSIGSNAFRGCEHLTKVVIPETVTEIGEYAFAYCMSLTEADIPGSVTYVGEYAFYQCDMLSQVKLPEGITEIDSFAFADCTELTTVVIPNSVETIGAYAFIGCTNLTDLTLGENVQTIGDSAFEGCVGLTEVTVPNGVTEFVYRMFAGCTSLEKITIPESVQSIGDMTFADCNTLTEITVPDSVETIGFHAFKQCENLSVVNIGKGVTQMGADVFFDCNQLTAIRVHQDNPVYSSDSCGALYQEQTILLRVPAKISGEFVIPDGVEEIAYGAFTGCTELTSVVVPGSVWMIPEFAFADCYGLTSVTLNEGIAHIGNMAFAFCSALEEIVFPSTVTFIGGECFVDCHGLKSVTLPEGLDQIQPYTFAWCYGLETVFIPKSMVAIADNAFTGCNELKEVIYGGRMSDWLQINIYSGNEALYNALITYAGDEEVVDSGSCGDEVLWSLTAGGKLTVFGTGDMYDYSLLAETAPWYSYADSIRSVVIEEGVTKVGKNAFYGCEAMTSLSVAGSVTTLGTQAFYGCVSLRSVTLNDGLVTIERNAFAECRSLETLVLPGTVEFLGESMFAYTQLRELVIPASVTTIEGDLFYNCPVTGIFVDAANANYSSDERGVLYNKGKTELLRAPCGISGSYEVPEGVETIASYAFFPCTGLTEILLPATLKTVGGYAFYNCNNLQQVYYAGSQQDWAAVSFGDENNSLLGTNIQFGEVENLGAGSCGDNVTWVLDAYGNMTISGSGDMYDYFNTPTELPWRDLRDQIVTLTVGEGVTAIGSIAFKNCQNLTSVTLPDSLREIGADAFYNCDGLVEIRFPEGLDSLHLRAFENCSRLERVYTNYDLSVIGERAFADCTNLTEFTFRGGLACISDEAFVNTGITSVILPDTLQVIGEYAFAGTSITELTIECSDVVILTELSKGAFKNCTALTAVNLGTNLQVLGEEVFSGCSALESILIPDSLTEIGANAFRNCASLFEIRIPDAVQTIREYTFYGCTNLNYVFMHGVKAIGDYAFYNAGFTFVDSTPELETIGIGAFASCSRLGSFISAPKLREIGSGAFQDCVSLSSVNLPEGVTTIEHHTFANCQSLTSVVLYNLVSHIGSNAFLDCAAMQELVFIGSRSQFEAIVIDEGNDSLLRAEHRFTEVDENVSYCTHCNEEVEWQDWNGVAGNGHYRLTGDYYGTQAMVGSASVCDVETVLDLSGYALYSNKRAFTVYTGNQLSVLDSVGGGIISGGATTTIGGAVLVSGGRFYLYNGTLTSQTTNSGGCVYVSNGGFFHMAGGQLIGAALSSGRRGGALYLAENTSVNLAGGLVTDGIARGASVYAAINSNLHLGNTTVGEVLAANSAYIMLYNGPVVEAMDLTSGAKLHMDSYLNRRTRITVYADDVFTAFTEFAEDNCQYFISGFEHSVISVVDNTLKVSYPDEQEIVDITIMEMPTKWQYEQGEMLDTTGLRLLVCYSDGYEQVVEDGFSCYGFESETSGVKTVYVVYGEYETFFNVMVNPKRVTNVEFYAYPHKTEYLVGEELDLDGIVLRVSYSNGDVDLIADGIGFSYDPFDCAGEYTVEITYGEFALSFNVTVKAREVEITQQPENALVRENETAQFHVEANNVVAYRWQYMSSSGNTWYNTTMSGYSTHTLQVKATLARSGYQYRCALTDADGKVTYTDAVTLEVIPLVITVTGIRIEKLPSKLVYTLGEELELAGMELMASYSYGPDGLIAEGYTVEGFDPNTTGEQTITVTYEGATAQFTVTVNMPAAEIVRQPEAVTADSGTNAVFQVGVLGDAVSYQWQYKRPDADQWFNTSMTGYNTDTLYVTASAGRHGNSFRCVITFADGTQLTSESAVLTVLTKITVTKQPNDQVVVLGYKGQFTVVAEGEGIEYQWQYKRPNADTWYDTNMDGATLSTVMVETTKARDGYQYRCKLTDAAGSVAYSDPATMIVLSYVEQPEDAYAPVNGTAQFTVKASTDSGFTYQWQYRRSATASWTNTSMTGFNTDTLTVTATKARNGYQYRCVLTGSKNSKLESNAVTLYVSEPGEITAQPQSVIATAADTAVFTVEATNVKSYQWMYSKNGTSWYGTSAEGNKTATLKVPAKNKNGYMYRCRIIGMDGVEYVTDTVLLVVGTADAALTAGAWKTLTAVDGRAYRITLSLKDSSVGVAYGDDAEKLEFQVDQEYLTEVDGKYYYFGSGDGSPITYTVTGDVIDVVGEYFSFTLERVSSTQLRFVSCEGLPIPAGVTLNLSAS